MMSHSNNNLYSQTEEEVDDFIRNINSSRSPEELFTNDATVIDSFGSVKNGTKEIHPFHKEFANMNPNDSLVSMKILTPNIALVHQRNNVANCITGTILVKQGNNTNRGWKILSKQFTPFAKPNLLKPA